jgi:hypothetical protein
MTAMAGLRGLMQDPSTQNLIQKIKRFPAYQPTDTAMAQNMPRLNQALSFVPDRQQIINFLAGEFPETFDFEGLTMMSDAELQRIIQQIGPPPDPMPPMPPAIAMSLEEEKGRTLSNMDKTIAAGMDNEPRFSERPVFSQIFTIDNEIKNLNKSLEIALRNNENMRAREIQDRIDSLNSLKQTMMPRDNIDQSLSEL